MGIRLSLRMICSRLQIKPSDIHMPPHDAGKFSRVRLWADPKTPEPETIYVTSGAIAPVDSRQLAGTALFVIGADRMDLDIPVVYFPPDTEVAALLNATMTVLEELNNWNHHLHQLVHQQAGFQELLDAAYTVLENPMYVVDANFKVLAITDDPRMCEISVPWKHLVEYGFLPLGIVAGMSTEKEFDQLDRADDAIIFHSKFFYNRFISYAIRIDGMFMGRLFVTEVMRKLEAADVELANHLGEILSQVMRYNDNSSINLGSVYELFLRELLNGTLQDKAIVKEYMDKIGWSGCSLFRVIKIPISEINLQLISMLGNLISENFNAQSLYMDASVVTVIAIKKRELSDGIEQLLEQILLDAKQIASISDSFETITELPKYYQQASDTLFLGMQCVDVQTPLIHHTDYAFKRLLHAAAKHMELPSLGMNEIMLLLDYDRETGAELANTLKVYLYNERSLAKAARKLFIHRNTLVQRLEKIHDLIKLDLNNVNMRLRLIITFEVLEYYCSLHIGRDAEID